jgi:hypothetical protein
LRDYLFYNNTLNNAKSLEDLQPALRKLMSNNALNMLNAKYLIINPQMAPITNNNALGNAWFADTVIFAENANSELSLLKEINPAKQAVIDIRFKDQVPNIRFPGNEGDKIELTSYRPDELVYNYKSVNEHLVIFSEIYYKDGWKAYIDNAERGYFRTDWILRGLVVPGGNHEIKFIFKPASYYVGNKISLASSFIFLLLAAGYIAVMLRNKKKVLNNDPS